MRFVDNKRINFTRESREESATLHAKALAADTQSRKKLIDDGKEKSWGTRDVENALKSAVGEKCWYSEIALAGSDINIDHFRPKGEISEIIQTAPYSRTGVKSEGYWWLAFELNNYRLSCQHANQRRVDDETDGGKWNFFPVDGSRASLENENSLIQERYLPLDPCSVADVKLLAFDANSLPLWSGVVQTNEKFDRDRVDLSIWLYHLKKGEIKTKREKQIETFDITISNAKSQYFVWQLDHGNAALRVIFNNSLAEIMHEILPTSEFSSAKRYKLKSRMADCDWIEKYIDF